MVFRAEFRPVVFEPVAQIFGKLGGVSYLSGFPVREDSCAGMPYSKSLALRKLARFVEEADYGMRFRG